MNQHVSHNLEFDFCVLIDENYRIDQLLNRLFPDFKRAFWQKCIENKQISINSSTVKKAQKTKRKDVVSVNYKIDKASQDVKIAYIDDDVVVFDKPQGLLTHQKGDYMPEFTLQDALAKYSNVNSDKRSGIVHRLDRMTSGLIICARNDQTLDYLKNQFKNRRVEKQYIALVDGVIEDENLELNLPISRNPKNPSNFMVSPNGKEAFTNLTRLDIKKNQTKVLLEPKTGRTHQLRVHLKYIGHPIVGDSLYNPKYKKGETLKLHASMLKISIGHNKVIELSSKPEWDN